MTEVDGRRNRGAPRRADLADSHRAGRRQALVLQGHCQNPWTYLIVAEGVGGRRANSIDARARKSLLQRVRTSFSRLCPRTASDMRRGSARLAPREEQARPVFIDSADFVIHEFVGQAKGADLGFAQIASEA
jgi:hypothetical protein